MDFKDAKELIRKTIVEPWDHAFIVFEQDLEVINFLNTLNNHKTVILKKVPTAENMALIAMQLLKDSFQKKYGEQITPIKVRLYETPNNWADTY
jgi:6-pyruvoyltetrahydropterin/6-carboxytetrahydropterin synthase